MVERVVADLESRAAPGKHDGDAIVRQILEQLERRPDVRCHAWA